MEEFPSIVRSKLGLALTSQELTKLFLKYYDPTTNKVDYEKLTSDLTKSVDDNEILARKETVLSINQIVIKIRANLLTKLDQWKEGDKLKNAYRLLSHSRSSVVDRAQLKNALQYRLFLIFNDREMDEIFKQFDPYGTGTIAVQNMINTIIRSDAPVTKNVASVDIGFNNQNYKIKNFNADKNQNAIYTYDKKFIGLSPPEPLYCLKISLVELEDVIRDKISERSSLSSNTIQTLTKLFGDGHSSNGHHYISKDQMRYTIWKKLKLNVSDDLIDQIFNKYDKKRSGQVLMFDFIDGIIRTNQKTEPILDDRFLSDSKSMAMKFKKSSSIKGMLVKVRDKINDLINRDSRAPHYLFHSVSKMTKGQAYDFFLKRLGLDIKAAFPNGDLLSELDDDYLMNGLVDVKRILIDAMSISEAISLGESSSSSSSSQSDGKSGMWGNTNNLSLRNGSVVDVNKMPLSLQEMRLSPKEIGALIFNKCLERMKHNHPLSSLHRILREAENDSDPRVITRAGLKHVLRKFDIIMNESDFNDFFHSHDRGDGKINARDFLDSLNPKSNHDQNPLLPKDEEELKHEHNVAKALQKITGRRREVSVMNGSTNTRLDGEILSTVTKSTPMDAEASVNPIISNIVATPPQTSKPNRPQSMRTMRTTSANSVSVPEPQFQESTETVANSQVSAVVGPEVNDASDSKVEPPSSSQAPPMSPKSAKLFKALQAAVNARRIRQAKQKKAKFATPIFRPAHSHQHFIDLDALLRNKANKEELDSADWNRSVRPHSAASATPQKVLLRISTFNKVSSMKNFHSSSQKSASLTTNPANQSVGKKQNQGKSRTDIFESTVVYNEPIPSVPVPVPVPVNKESSSKTSHNNNNNNYYNEVSTIEQLMEQLLTKHNATKDNKVISNNNNTTATTAAAAARKDAINSDRSSSGLSGPVHTPVKAAQRSESIVMTPQSPISPRSSTQTPRSTFSRPSTASPTKPKSPFVYTGQPRQFVPSPFSPLLHMKYKMDKKHLVTSHEDYGMFVKSMTKAAKSQQLLGKKYKATLSPSHSLKM